jgi:hypothetical protein
VRRHAIVAGGGLLILAAGLSLAQQAAPGGPGPDPGLKELAERRAVLARRLLADFEATWLGAADQRPERIAAGTLQFGGGLSRRLMEAEFDRDPTPAGRAAAIGGHIARLQRWVEPITRMASTSGSAISQREVDELNLDLLEARAMLLREAGGPRRD